MKILDKIRKNENPKEDFQRKLELFRAHYLNTYGIRPDDEVLYIFMRINELQFEVIKNIKNISEVRFKSSWDYFMYALGGSLKWLWTLLSLLALSSAIVYYTDHKITYHQTQNTEMIKLRDSVANKKTTPVNARKNTRKSSKKK